MTMETVYLETTIFSYLTARPSRDVVVAGHQQTTADWWEKSRSRFICVVSDFLVDEIERGNPEMAAARLALTEGMMRLQTTPVVRSLSKEFLSRGAFPPRAAADALHVALATVDQVDYLLTWNCAHLANAQLIAKMAAVASAKGWKLPVICTPDGLMGD